MKEKSDEDGEEVLAALKGPRRYVKGKGGNQLTLSAILQREDNMSRFKVKGLLDSGATGSCINRSFVERNNIPTKPTPIPIPVYNTDGSRNSSGTVKDIAEMRLTIQDHSERIELAVVELGKWDLFIGHDWLKYHNPSIDWEKSTVEFDRCPMTCGYQTRLTDIDADLEVTEDMEGLELEDGERLFMIRWELDSINTEPLNMPDYVNEFQEVFGQQEFDKLPERRSWDHTTELVPGATPKDCKVYPLNPTELKALDEFLKENLQTGRIRPSQSPMAAPFFFVKKKDGKL